MRLPAGLPRIVALAGALLLASGHTAAAVGPVALHWLDGAPPAQPAGVSWGVPWPRGTLQKGQDFALQAADGRALPVQTWPLAYWPDGSIKWSGHAVAGIPAPPGNALSLVPTAPVTGGAVLHAVQDATGIAIDTGVIQCRIPSSGSSIISGLTIGGRTVAQDGQLVALREDRSGEGDAVVTKVERFTSAVRAVTLEQAGPVRAVVKIEGVHQAETSGRAWLPFTLRLYFYAGLDSVRLVHSFVFDGDQEKDFIRGLGVRFNVPLKDELQNRHVSLVGEDTGVLAEPVRLITGREPRDTSLYAKQLAGQRVPDLKDLPDKAMAAQLAAWDAFKLVQGSADAFTIQKRTNPRSAWINAAAGRRSPGLAFVGDTTGGLALGLRNFWQMAPRELEIEKATTDTAELTAWLWSPDAPAMDMRHYDVVVHGLQASYEDIDDLSYSTATGVARTNELTLRAFAAVPDNARLVALAAADGTPAHLVCAPEYYHGAGVFGYWSLPNRANPVARGLEDQLDRMFAFYHGQVEERRWYGFWDYGDVMHTYDPLRHMWKYDVGGYAWMNSEEAPDLWLWYSFLRTGRADIFHMAEAMTRKTQEVNVYHLGRFAGLGSRHNVRAWGDGSKEVRISQAMLKRFYYYLTTDERTGDLMHEVVNADYALVEVDPLRKILKPTQYPTHARSGPDWLACAGNWMTEWERTGDTKWRDKIVTGLKDLAAMPGGLRTSLSFAYDPKTGHLYDVPEKQKTGQFVMIFGGAETAFELGTLVDVPGWSKAWLDLCEEWARTGAGDMAGPRAAGFAAFAKNDPALGRRAWELMFARGDGTGRERFPATPLSVPPADLPVPAEEVLGDMATGHLSQWALNIIGTLELAGRWLPTEVPAPASSPARRP
ncbi:MAG TPA: Tat pathway signal sequence domain protein [Opitutaceae bacterium]|nr:Tat pathway signal sequence domain protein [Opitutaceae bacterium]